MGKEQELLEAARTGNVALVEKLLSGKKKILGSGSGSIPLPNLLSMWKGLNVNCTDSSGYTPLHHASLNGHRDVVLKLLQFEASPNVADNKGCFPLHLAAWRGDADIVRILVHHGPSHCRVNQQARLPRRRFADTNDPSNHEKETALHCAAQYGHSDVVSVLLHELTDPTMRNSRQETPLDLAALYGRLEVVCMLINTHPNLMTCHCRRHTPLHLAARNGHHSTVQTLLEAGMDVNCVTDNGSALHEAALFGKMDVVRLLLDSEYMMDEMERSIVEEPVRKCPVPAPRTSVSSPSSSPSIKHKNDAMTSELSKLLHEIKKCRDRDYSFEELCQTISSHSMDSFGSGRLSDEERPDRPNGTLTRVFKRPTPPLAPAPEQDEVEKSCGPSGFWEALTPCNGCRNLGFTGLSQDSKYSSEVVTSPSLDVFLPEDEDNPYESVTTAVTRKPCSLDINRRLDACPGNARTPTPADAHAALFPFTRLPQRCNTRQVVTATASPDDESPVCCHGNYLASDTLTPTPSMLLTDIERACRPYVRVQRGRRVCSRSLKAVTWLNDRQKQRKWYLEEEDVIMTERLQMTTKSFQGCRRFPEARWRAGGRARPVMRRVVGVGGPRLIHPRLCAAVWRASSPSRLGSASPAALLESSISAASLESTRKRRSGNGHGRTSCFLLSVLHPAHCFEVSHGHRRIGFHRSSVSGREWIRFPSRSPDYVL
ncbi:hypothetical protein fugu_020041 [Takifugu bimaculatus]|uniref:Uncharacterized protein n=1 Tax=Takifugu bimaculatus TaxID=433685 RepID=A0A4Z2BGZ9_9TELE|nr:hypothetical protein fugu_020041 [Takifugu bimaculatus]